MRRSLSAISPVLTVRDLSNYLRVHLSTVYQLLKTGQLPAFKVGRDWRFNVEAIDRWRVEREKSPGMQGAVLTAGSRSSNEVIRQAVAARLSEETAIGGQRQSSLIRRQREMSCKLKAAEKQAKRQSRTTDKPKSGTDELKLSMAAGADDSHKWR